MLPTSSSHRQNTPSISKRKLRSKSGAHPRRRRRIVVSASSPDTEEIKSVVMAQSTPHGEDVYGHAEHIYKEIKANYDLGSARKQRLLDRERARIEEESLLERQQCEAKYVCNVL
jgi:hypothetical protein